MSQQPPVGSAAAQERPPQTGACVYARRGGGVTCCPRREFRSRARRRWRANRPCHCPPRLLRCSCVVGCAWNHFHAWRRESTMGARVAIFFIWVRRETSGQSCMDSLLELASATAQPHTVAQQTHKSEAQKAAPEERDMTRHLESSFTAFPATSTARLIAILNLDLRRCAPVRSRWRAYICCWVVRWALTCFLCQ